MKATAKPSHHEAKPRREIRIDQESARIGLDVSVNGLLSTISVFEILWNLNRAQREIIIKTL
jgi:hypothetical protein